MTFKIQLYSESPLSEKVVLCSSHGCLKISPKNLEKKEKRPKAHPIKKDFSWEIQGKIIKCSTFSSIYLPN